jgi:hypothetical protein
LPIARPKAHAPRHAGTTQASVGSQREEQALIPGVVPLKRRAWPLVAALLFLVLGLALVLMNVEKNPLRLAYPTDDTYISMVMSKNLVEHGTWGVNPGEFAPAASSPLWVLLQAAAMKVFGARLWVPFALALVCAVGLLLMVDSFGRREGWPDYFRATILLLLVMVTPLVPLTVLGMEHILHIIFTLWTLDLLWRLPERGLPVSRGHVVCLLAAILLTTATRFEGLFMALAAACVLIWQRRVFLAVGMICASLVPVAIYGIVSISHGWGWLPSSVMLKGNMPVHGHPLEIISTVLDSLINQYYSNLHIACDFMAPLVVLALLSARWLQQRVLLVIGVFVLVFAQHMCFAKIGWFYRYEAYLLAAQLFVIGLIVGPALPQQAGAFWLQLKHPPALTCIPLALAVMLPQIKHGSDALSETPVAMKNICDQQCQMAEFVRRYYAGASVAVNDIGAVSDFGQAHITDLGGLANRTLFRAKRAGDFNTKVIQRVCDDEHVVIAIVYDHWFTDEAALPSDWRRVGTLTIEYNFVCGGDTIVFYALNNAAAAKLDRDLRDFAATVPSDVHVRTISMPGLNPNY